MSIERSTAVLLLIASGYGYSGSQAISDDALSGATLGTSEKSGQKIAQTSKECLPPDESPEKLNELIAAKALAFFINTNTGQAHLIRNTKPCIDELNKQP